MKENIEKLKNKNTDKAEEAPKKEAVAFEYSEEDIQAFKEWRKERESNKAIVAKAPEDDELRRKWKEESKLVKGIFRCREPIGGGVKFCFRKYKWDTTKWYEMTDGEVYEIPLAVARHLNNNCSYPVHSHVLGADGNPSVDRSGKMESRMSFESTQFAEV